MKRLGFALAAAALLSFAGHTLAHAHDRDEAHPCALCAAPATLAPDAVVVSAPADPGSVAVPRLAIVTSQALPAAHRPRSPPSA